MYFVSLSLSGNFWLKCGLCFLWIPASRMKCCWPSLRGYESGPSLCEVFRMERSETPGTKSGSFSIAVGQLSPLGYSNVRRMAMTVPAWRTVAVRVTKCAVVVCVSSLLWKQTVPFFKKICSTRSRVATGGQSGSPLRCWAVAYFGGRGEWWQWSCLTGIVDFKEITNFY